MTKAPTLLALIVSCILTCGYGAAEETLGIFETSASISLDVSVFPLNAEMVGQIEVGTSAYYHELLDDRSHNALPETTKIISVWVDFENEQILPDSGATRMASVLRVTHTGLQGLPDLAGLLLLITGRNSTDTAFSTLETFIGLNATIENLSVTNKEESTLLYDVGQLQSNTSLDSDRSNEEKALIISVGMLSFFLVSVSVILVWMAGSWLALRKQNRVMVHREEELTRQTAELESKPTADTTDEEMASPEKDDNTAMTNPSGILGVNPNYNIDTGNGNMLSGLGVKMTPSRMNSDFSEMGSEIATPMSEGTAYTETGRMPLGITSMRKLLPNGADGMPPSHGNGFRVERLMYK